MLTTVIKKTGQQVILLSLVSLVLLAAYVSVGRQFMPAISRYGGFLEEQILAITGLPVRIETLTGSFQGLNPAIRLDGLSLLVNGQAPSVESAPSSFLFDSASLIVDIPRSIWQRRWVLQDFIIEGLSINAEQTAAGSWQLTGVDIGGEGNIDTASVYRSFLQVSHLSLRNVAINLTARNGNSFNIINGLAVIQNRNGNHFLHVNANLEASSRNQIAFSLEVRGEELDEIDGRLHLQIPEADYSKLFEGEKLGEVVVQQLIGGGEFWVGFADGQVSEVISQPNVASVTYLTESSEPVTLQSLSGTVSLHRGTTTGARRRLIPSPQIS